MITDIVVQKTGNWVTLIFLIIAMIALFYIGKPKSKDTQQFVFYFWLLVLSITARLSVWTISGWAGIHCYKQYLEIYDAPFTNFLCEQRHIIMFLAGVGIGCSLMGLWNSAISPISIKSRYGLLFAVIAMSYLVTVW